MVALKDELDINIELASPPDFVPELPSWRDRSPLVARESTVTVRHFDPYSQALWKIERGFPRDLQDVAAMLERGLVDRERARVLFAAAEPGLIRYPAIDPAALRRKIEAALGPTRPDPRRDRGPEA